VLEKYPAFEHVQALFVVVSPEAIKCISFAEMASDKVITAASPHHLYERAEFVEDSAIIKYYAGYVRKVITEGLKDRYK